MDLKEQRLLKGSDFAGNLLSPLVFLIGRDRSPGMSHSRDVEEDHQEAVHDSPREVESAGQDRQGGAEETEETPHTSSYGMDAGAFQPKSGPYPIVYKLKRPK